MAAERLRATLEGSVHPTYWTWKERFSLHVLHDRTKCMIFAITEAHILPGYADVSPMTNCVSHVCCFMNFVHVETA